ncbi:MAG: IclR family transcriptional regulator [Pigmentiphaga sp.]
MSGLAKMLELLRLITPANPVVNVDQVCEVLGCGASTAYRYIRELTDAGLLVRLPGGFALGARIIQLDLQMRQTDPLLHHGLELLVDLVRQTGLSALLSEVYNDAVITLHEEPGAEISELHFGRGRAMPLSRGATGRIIMAHMQPRPLRRIYDQMTAEHPGEAVLPNWKEFSREMLVLRRQGYCLTRGEVEAGRVGLSAPIFDDGRVLGSVSLVGSIERFAMFNEPYIGTLVCEAARTLSQRISVQPHTVSNALAASDNPSTHVDRTQSVEQSAPRRRSGPDIEVAA